MSCQSGHSVVTSCEQNRVTVHPEKSVPDGRFGSDAVSVLAQDRPSLAIVSGRAVQPGSVSGGGAGHDGPGAGREGRLSPLTVARR